MAKYYYKTKNSIYFTVIKSINGEKVSFGTYRDEEITKRIVEELKKVDWDKKELSRIRKKIRGYD